MSEMSEDRTSRPSFPRFFEVSRGSRGRAGKGWKTLVRGEISLATVFVLSRQLVCYRSERAVHGPVWTVGLSFDDQFWKMPVEHRGRT